MGSEGACGLFDGLSSGVREPVSWGLKGKVGGGSGSGGEGEWWEGVCTRCMIGGEGKGS